MSSTAAPSQRGTCQRCNAETTGDRALVISTLSATGMNTAAAQCSTAMPANSASSASDRLRTSTGVFSCCTGWGEGSGNAGSALPGVLAVVSLCAMSSTVEDSGCISGRSGSACGASASYKEGESGADMPASPASVPVPGASRSAEVSAWFIAALSGCKDPALRRSAPR